MRTSRSIRAALGVAIIVFGFVNVGYAAAMPDDRSLAPAALRLSDLPRGWAIANDTGRDENGGRVPPLCGIAAPIAIARSLRGFHSKTWSTTTSVVMRFRDGQAKAYLDALGPALAGDCQQAIESGLEGNDPVEGRYVRLPVPKLGDQTLGLRLEAAPFASEVVVIRRGNLVAMVGTGAIGGPTLPVVPLARTVAARLAKLR